LNQQSYWGKSGATARLLARRASRRNLLRTAVLGAGGLTLFGVACSGNNNNNSGAANKAAATGSASVSPTGASASSPAPGAATAAATRAASPTVAAQAVRKGGTLQTGIIVDLEGFDPHATVGTAVKRVFTAGIYDTLIGYAPQDLSLTPGLATKWETPDPMTIVFTLRDGVQFHDGTSFDAAAAKYNIERSLGADTKAADKGDMAVISAVEATDPHTVKLTLKQPSAPLLAVLGDRPGMMISPAAAAKKDPMDSPVGTGPFQFDSFSKGSKASFKRFANYWRKANGGDALPYLDGFQVNIITDEQQLFNALVTNSIQMMEVGSAGTSGAFIDRISSDNNLNFVGGYTRSIKTIAVNEAFPPVDNVNLRRAIAAAIDAKAVGDAVYYHYKLLGGPATPADWAYDASIQPFPFDKNKAKDFLTQGGQPNGFSFPGMVSTTPEFMQVAQLVQAQLAQVGIKWDYQTVDRATILDQVYGKGNTGATVSGNEGRADFGQEATTLFGKTGSLHLAAHRPGFQSSVPQIDDLIAQGERTYDTSQRKQIYSQLQKLAVDNVYNFVPLVYPQGGFGVRKSVQNFVFYGDNLPRLHEVWISG
jgi:peptide/nickel transport system substrate-binding protein